MSSNEIGIILENGEKEVIKDASIEKMLALKHNRYLVLSLNSQEICFLKIKLDDDGLPELEDINDEKEFKNVENAYSLNPY